MGMIGQSLDDGPLLLTVLPSDPDATSLSFSERPRPIMNTNMVQDSTIGTDLENAPPQEKTK